MLAQIRDIIKLTRGIPRYTLHAMKQKLASTVLLLLILTGQISPAPTKIAASVRKKPLVILGFDRCAGDRCFLGIIPGKTSWQDTTSILLKHSFTKDIDTPDMSYSRFEPNEPFQIGIHVYRVPDNPSVTQAVDM